MRKKIGLVTCFINNYGACLQAYALQKTIVSLGCDCEIINYVEPSSYDKKTSFVSNFLKNRFTRFCMGLLNKHYRLQLLSRRKFNQFRANYLSLTIKEFLNTSSLGVIASDYDAFICGSDQIWNPFFCGDYYDAYMLAFAKETRRIAYAPSIGLNNYPEKWRNEFSENLKHFSSLSCREETGSKIIREISKKDCRTVLDPTLLINCTQWKQLIHDYRVVDERYVFCYLFDDRDFYCDFVIDTCKKLSAQPVIIHFIKRQESWPFKCVYDAGPLDFVNLISNASFVVTDSFHATAFSINLNTPFYSLVRNLKNGKIDMSSRIVDILSLTNLSKRLILDNEYDINVLEYNIDFKESNNLLEKKRKEDLLYLRNALDIEC